MRNIFANIENVTKCDEIDYTENHEEKPMKQCTEANEDKHYTWFKDTFLDSRCKLKKEIYQKLARYYYITIFTFIIQYRMNRAKRVCR